MPNRIRVKILLFIGGLLPFLSTAQFSSGELIQGYAVRKDSLYFVFSESVYQENLPEKVVVTGQFRNWSQDLADKRWELSRVNAGVWSVGLKNKEFAVVSPGSGFKFRIGDGKWLDPPKDASNVDGGNLIFMKGIEPLALEAGFESDGRIEVWIRGLNQAKPRIPGPGSFVLKDAFGKRIPIAKVEPSSAGSNSIHCYLQAKNPVDKRRVYYLEQPSNKLKCLVSFEPWFSKLKSDKVLGAEVSPDGKQTSFRVFSPRATGVKLYLYKDKDSKEASDVISMKIDEQGVWEYIAKGDLHGTWYDFTVHGFSDPGNSFFETHPVHISDPYARVSDDSFGKCMVARKTKPAAPLANGRPKLENVIAYEVHVQDFTDLLPIGDDLRGTISGMVVPGLKNTRGEKIGFDYLVENGVNTVHLMPVQEMLHWPQDEWERAFSKDAWMREQGVALENYDWGYRTSHSFAIETRYRRKATNPGDEREQFRDLVEAFHKKGIAVIVDFVFNHTAENMDGRNYLFHFNALDKQYYYRTKNLEHIGAYGNETKSENRYMVQRWIIDQCKHFINEFGIDGFRIDLAGQTDQQTLLRLKSELPEDIIIYGEPWIDSNDPNYNRNPDWHWYKEDAPICYFNDDTRNTYKGPVFELKDPALDRGWAGGNAAQFEDVKRALACDFPTQKTINSGINYLDIHDNFALADQFGLSNWDGRFGVDEGAYKIAATLLFTTPGPIVLHGGSEFMRSKGMAELKETEKEIPSGKIYFHGKRDTYNMRAANWFIWDLIGKPNGKSTNQPYENADYKGMQLFWRDLMRFRKEVLFGLKSFKAESGKPDIKFIDLGRKTSLAYVIDDSLLVVLNPDASPLEFSGKMPKGNWKLILDENRESRENAIDYTRLPTPVTMAPKSLRVFIRQ